MTSSQIIIMIAIVIYLAFMVYVGFYYTKRNNNVGDFYLGGRKLGPFVTAMSAEASDMSSYLLMGVPGVAYLSGLADASWTAIGLAVGTYINWLIVAKRIRTYSHKLDAITVPEFFSNRYHDKKNLLACIAALIIIIFFIPYTASGFAACGKLFSSLFGFDYFWAMLVSAIIIVGYTTLGGFMAASFTDLVQSIIMTIAIVVALCFGISVAGGIDNVIANAQELPGYLDMNATYDAATGTASDYGFITKISTLAWGLGYFGMPHILLRFMAIEDKQKLKLSRRVASIWVVISLGVAVAIGIVGYSMSKVGAIDTLEGTQSETVIIKIAELISSHGVLAAIVAGIILAGILAATMSTADSQLLAASSSVSQNLLRDFFGIKMSERASMLVARLTVVIVSIIAVVFASNPESSVFQIVSFAWAGFGACFGPVVLCALFWKRSNKQGVLAGMVVGAITIFVWKYGIRPLGGAWDIYELLPAFLLALATIIVVSLLTKAPDASIDKEFEQYKEAVSK
ncbi:MAG TPA: sodium/proline symporter [Anaerovoracaceae bacterium]|nr:sodium/proline symporter [Anaerovoracaceae bacterium]